MHLVAVFPGVYLSALVESALIVLALGGVSLGLAKDNQKGGSKDEDELLNEGEDSIHGAPML